jgi:hypothetical protein
MKLYPFLLLIALLAGCSTAKVQREFINSETFKIRIAATDSTYGYSPDNAIKVGGPDGGPRNERRFLNALLGPNGETVKYHREGSCCFVKSANAPFGGDHVPLDRYAIYWPGIKDTLELYINMYDSDILQIPVGLKAK